MCRFHVRQLARNTYFVQMTLASPLLFTVLKHLAVRGSGEPVDPLTGWEAGVAGIWALTCTAAGMVGFQRFQGVLEAHAASPRRPAAAFVPIVTAATVLGLVDLPLAWLASAAVGDV